MSGKEIFPMKLFITTIYLLEMYPSFPCRKRGHRRAWFEVLVDCCYCGSIQRDCQLETFSVMRDGRGWEGENERTSRRKLSTRKKRVMIQNFRITVVCFRITQKLIVTDFSRPGFVND